MEFVKAWYPGLDLDRLATLRSEAQPELAATEDALVKHAAVIAEYTDTSIFIPERSEDGEEVPPEWFGMNPDYGEDSAEDGGEAEAPEDGADGQPQLDRASSNEPRATDPTAAGGDQAETSQPAAPTPGAGASSDPPSPSAAS